MVDDGAVIEAEEFNLGGQGVAYNDANTANNGGQFRPSEGVDIQTTSDTGGGFNVGWTSNGEWLEYTFDSTGGLFDISARVASNNSNPGDLEVQVGDGTTFSTLGTIAVSNTGGWQSWQDETLSGVTIDSGTQVLRVNMVGGSINLNRFDFSTSTSTSTTPAAVTGAASVTGTHTVGETLNAAQGTLFDPNGITEIAYLWQRRVGTSITDITSGYSTANTSYTLVAADGGNEVRAVARITDNFGNNEWKATPFTAVNAANPPSPTTGSPAVTGTHTEGQALTAGQGTLADPNGIQEIAYLWQRRSGGTITDISSGYSTANANYTLVAADGGNEVRVAARITDNLGTVEYKSSAFTAVDANSTTPAPTTGAAEVTGTHTVGQTLTAGPGTLADPNGIQMIAYQWQRLENGSAVALTNYSTANTSYTLVTADGGQQVRVVAQVTDNLGTNEWKPTPFVAVDAVSTTPAPTTGAAVVTGTHTVGQTLTASQGTLADPNGITEIAYQWQRRNAGGGIDNLTNYSTANTTYTLVAADSGDEIRVVAQVTDGLGTNEWKPTAFTTVNPGSQTGLTTAVANGNWTNANTWSNGVPNANTQVVIPQGRTVTINTASAAAETVVVQGTLNVNETAGQNRGLTTRWMHVNSGGLFQVGTASNRFNTANFTLTLTGRNKLADWTIPTATGSMNITDNDGFLMPAGGGRIQMFGEDKISFTKLSATVAAGATQIFVANVIERNFDGTTNANSDGALNWEVGDQIVVASSTQDYNEEEVRTITGILDLGNGNTRLTLSSALSFRHYGVIERYDNNSRSIDMRAEVSLLSRNVKVSGVAAADTDNSFGDRARYSAFNSSNPNATGNGISGHVMIMPTAGAVDFDGVQFDRLGQTATRGRYPVHWHLGGDRTGDTLIRSSVTNSNNRGVTIHATDNLLIQDVVLHDIHGHGFFMENAVETGNTFLSNITYGIHQVGVSFNGNGVGYYGRAVPNTNDPFIVDTHDVVQQNETRFVSAAGYWLTNPDNTWIGNISAGAFGTGFWFLFPDSAINESANDPAFNNYRPDRQNLREFRNNSSHSSIIGLNFDRGGDIEGDINATLQPRSFGDEYNPTVEPVIDSFTAYKHNVGVYHRGREANFLNNRYADNFNSTFITFTQRITNALYVGHSQGNADTSEIVTGHTFYDGPNTLDGTHFAGFQRNNAHTYRSAFIAVRNTHFMMSDTTFENDGSHDNVSTRVTPQGTTNIAPFGKGQPSVIYDVDGSFTGSYGGGAGSTVIPDHPFYYDSNDTRPTGWNSRVSDDPYGTFRISGANDPLARITTPDGDTDDERTGSSTGFGINAVFKMNPINTNQTDAGDYTISFPNAYTGNFDVRYSTTLGPLGWTMMEFTNQSTNRVNNRPLVANLATLQNATQTSWARSGNSIWVKFFSNRNGNNSIARFRPVALQAAAPATEIADVPTLTNTDVDSLVDDATAYWSGRGVDTNLFANVNFVIKDLGSNLLGLQGGNTIFLDDDAAGFGWYVDSDPTTNESFTGMDLFTTLTHELGHVLGLDDLYGDDDEEELMFGFLSEGERRATFTV